MGALSRRWFGFAREGLPRRFGLRFALAAAVCLAGPIRAETMEVQLLQLNDVYEIAPTPGADGGRGGLARVATLRQRLKARNPHTLTLLAGDALSPSALGTAKLNGEPLAGRQMVAVLNRMGLDLATFGNHEFDLSEAQYRERLRESKFQWLSSNVTDASGRPFPGVPSSRLMALEGKDGGRLRLGVLGVTLASNPATYVRYADPLEAARSEADRLRRQGADVVIGLTHLSLAEDQRLAAAVPAIDLILGGHEHENVQQWRLLSRAHRPGSCPDPGTPIFKADANAGTVYVLTLRYDTVRRCLHIGALLQPITGALPADPAVQAEVEQWQRQAFAGFRAEGFEPGAIVATTAVPLDGREASVRNGPTALTEAIAAAMLAAVEGAELAVFNAGAIRIDDVIPPGPIRQYDVIRVLPFGGQVVEVAITGDLLAKVLDQGRANRGSGGFLQTAGVTGDGQGGWRIAGQPLQPARTYRIAVSDFMMTGREQGLGLLGTANASIQRLGNRGEIRQQLIRYWGGGR
ncbi:MAG: 5'-nucleotidase [Cyanobium sp. CACIAM 14]|nr:MAG: 5'-nucleotidase [Cyanobium sp. CACIAM 14]